MLKQIIFWTGFLLYAHLGMAQESYSAYPAVNEQCGTMHLRAGQQENISKKTSQAQFEEWLSRKIEEMDFSKREGITTIPTVVHVIHNGEPVGTYPNISDAQIISQINVLNQDFRRMEGTNGFNEHPNGADMEIEFCLAIIDPNQNLTNGINRQNLGSSTWDMEQIENEVKPHTIWNPEQYFNIWVCNLTGIVLGYAQLPESSGLDGIETNENENTDGIVVGTEYFGTIEEDDGTFVLDETYNLGRTATHETGHFLGLLHIWGDGDCDASDYCEDTPNAIAANAGCPTGTISCETEDMIENYMDYTDDACANVFTNDQKIRMQTVLANSPRRASLMNAVLCTPPPSFSYTGQIVDINTQEGIPNASVVFKGLFSIETTADDDGIFTIPILYQGEYEVFAGKWGSVTAQLENQYFDENTDDLIIELDRGYYDDFIFDFGWEITSNPEEGAWVRDIPKGSAFDGVQYDPIFDVSDDYGKACFLTGNSGGSAGVDDVDNGTATLASPIFDASLYENPSISLYRWFATGNGTMPDDQLEISLSNGFSTEIVAIIDGNDDSLSTWVKMDFVISDYINPTDNMRLIISTSDQVTSVNGHLVDAAIDRFEVRGFWVGNENWEEENSGISLFPNPTNGTLSIKMENLKPNIQIHVFNALGEKIKSQEILEKTTHLHLNNEAKGIYFLQFQLGEKTFVKKVMVH